MLTRTKVEKIIGKTFADRLDEDIFKVSDNWALTRREMVSLIGCGNFIAAAKLAKVLKRLKVNNPAQLFKIDPVSLARVKGIGESSIFVAMCILDSSGYDVITWWNKETKFSAVKKARKNRQEV